MSKTVTLNCGLNLNPLVFKLLILICENKNTVYNPNEKYFENEISWLNCIAGVTFMTADGVMPNVYLIFVLSTLLDIVKQLYESKIIPAAIKLLIFFYSFYLTKKEIRDLFYSGI